MIAEATNSIDQWADCHRTQLTHIRENRMSKPKTVEEWMARYDREPYRIRGRTNFWWDGPDGRHMDKEALPWPIAELLGIPYEGSTAAYESRADAVEALRVALVKLGEIEEPQADGGGTITNVPVDSPIETMFGQSSGALTVKTLSDSQRAIISECNDVMKMLLEKNKAYGDSAINPVRLFSKAGAVEQINVRIDDKLSRLMRGEAAGEDVELDLIGYLVLKRVARKAVK